MKQNKKQIVKLTESQFKGVITKSVKKVLKESMFDYDEVVDEWYNSFKNACFYADEIKNGVYDNKLKDKKWRDKISYFNGFDADNGAEQIFTNAIKNRLMILDKDYAWKQLNYKDKDNRESINWEKDYYAFDGDEANRNIKDLPYGRNEWLKIGDSEEEIKKLKSKTPELFKKDGNMRTQKQILKNINNRSTQLGANIAADKKMLHRKGSANRDLMSIDSREIK